MLKFKNFLLNEKLLLENRISDLKDRYSDKLDKKIIDYFEEQDFTNNKAYLEWMLKTYSNMSSLEKEKLEELKTDAYIFVPKIIKMFNGIKFMLKAEQKNINKYKTISELYDVVIEQIKDYSEEAIKEKGKVDIHVNNDEWLIFTPYEYSVANEYGHNKRGGANWCVCYEHQYFNQYLCPDGAITMIINKLDSSKDFAIQYDIEYSEFHIWDWQDKDVLFYEENVDVLIDYLENEEGYEFVIEWIKNTEIEIPSVTIEDLKSNWLGYQNVSDYVTLDDVYSASFDSERFMEEVKSDMLGDDDIMLEYTDTDDMLQELNNNGIELEYDSDVNILHAMDDNNLLDVWLEDWIENHNTYEFIKEYIEKHRSVYDIADYIDQEEYFEKFVHDIDMEELTKYYYENL